MNREEKNTLTFQNTFQRFTVKIPKCYLLLPLKYQNFYCLLIFNTPSHLDPLIRLEDKNSLIIIMKAINQIMKYNLYCSSSWLCFIHLACKKIFCWYNRLCNLCSSSSQERNSLTIIKGCWFVLLVHAEIISPFDKFV